MKKKNILFVVENDYFPRDTRVYNECITLTSSKEYNCFAFAPRNNRKKEKFLERIDNDIICFRYPHYESYSTLGLLLEYGNAFFWNAIVIPIIVFFYKIDVIHVANPPDFLLPSLFWLKLFKIKFVFDQHDISIIHFNSKIEKLNFFFNIIRKVLLYFEKLSIELADLVIAPNTTCRDYEKTIKRDITSIVVRNSNKILYQNIDNITKRRSEILQLGFIGMILTDKASGIKNLVKLANYLSKDGIRFKFDIIGDGPGLNKLIQLVRKNNLEQYFEFYGFLNLNDVFNNIVNCDFGIVTLNFSRKGNYASSMKVMDYMCCGVPVCSLKLKEQLITTNGIGIHTDSFVEMADEIIRIYTDKNEYEELRRKTLEQFNENLCWEKQAPILLNGYAKLIYG